MIVDSDGIGNVESGRGCADEGVKEVQGDVGEHQTQGGGNETIVLKLILR